MAPCPEGPEVAAIENKEILLESNWVFLTRKSLQDGNHLFIIKRDFTYRSNRHRFL
jgi:hypothetical protein